MAQPTPYVRSYSFTDYSAAFPNGANGVQMDDEFDKVGETLGQTIANLARIQRDDGQLANGVVTSDALSPGVIQALNYGATPAADIASGLSLTKAGDRFQVANDDGTTTIYLHATNGEAVVQQTLLTDFTLPGAAAFIGTADGETVQEKLSALASNRVVRAAEAGIAAHSSFDAAGKITGVVVDQAPAIQALLYSIAAKGGGILRFDGQQGAIPLGSSLIVPQGVHIDGVSYVHVDPALDYSRILRFMPMASGEFYDNTGTLRSVATDGNCQAGILFWANIDPTDDPNSWIYPPDLKSSLFENMHIDGSMVGGIKAFRFAGGHHFRDCRTTMVGTFAEKPNLYTDQMRFENIHCARRPNATDYYLDLQGLGDGSIISGIETDQGLNSDDTSVQPGIRLLNARGAILNSIVNGAHLIQGCSGVIINGTHQEGGSWTLDASDVTFNGGSVYHGKGNPTAPIVIRNSSAVNKETCRVTLNDVVVIHSTVPVGPLLTGWSDTPLLDVDLQTNRASLVMNAGCRRRATTGVIGHSWQTALMVGDSTGSGVFTNWKNYAAMLGSAPITINHQRVIVNGKMPNRAVNWNGLASFTYVPVGGEGAVAYKGATGDNTYFARPLNDPVRLIGRAASVTASVTIAAVNGSTTLPGFSIDLSDGTNGACMWEVLRDTGNDGNYDKRVQIPGIDAERFVDDGDALNSFAWEAYGPGAPATLNNNAMPVRCEYTDGLITLCDSIVGTPTAGAWQSGDMIYRPNNAANSAGMKLDGTQCTVGGSPGTWLNRYVSSLPHAAGQIATSTDASGDVVVTHGLGSTPVNVQVEATMSTFAQAQAYARSSTTFTVRFFDAAGVAIASTAVTADWLAQ